MSDNNFIVDQGWPGSRYFQVKNAQGEVFGDYFTNPQAQQIVAYCNQIQNILKDTQVKQVDIFELVALKAINSDLG